MKNKIKISAFFWLLAAGLFACTRFENDELPSPVNGPAKLNNDTYATAKNKPVQLVVLRNDTITTDGILMFGQPAHGAIISDSVGFTYYPQTSFLGTDSFYYKYCSATTCDSALVKVLVYDPEPGCTVAANHDQAAISSSAPVTFSILSNDNTCGPVTVQFGNVGNSVMVYPNPFEREVKLDVDAEKYAVMEVTVTNLMGKQLMIKNINLTQGKNTTTLDMGADLPAGVYIITTRFNGVTSNFKLLKR